MEVSFALCSPVGAPGEIPDPGLLGSDDGIASALFFLLGGIVLEPDMHWAALPLVLPLDLRLVSYRDWAAVMVAQAELLDVLGCGLSLHCSSTTGSAHRCRRPSLVYSTPFDCVWSKLCTVLRLFDDLSRLFDAFDIGVVARTQLSDALRPCQ